MASLGEIALRTALVYGFLLLGIRLSGKRQIGQLTPFDLVLLLLVSNSVQNAMTGPDVSVTGGLVAAAMLLLMNSGVAWVRNRNLTFARFVEGVPVVLVDHGEIQHRNLVREKMTEDDLSQVLREHEVTSCDQVELAMLEIDGSVSVIRRVPDKGFVRTRRKFSRHHRTLNN